MSAGVMEKTCIAVRPMRPLDDVGNPDALEFSRSRYCQ